MQPTTGATRDQKIRGVREPEGGQSSKRRDRMRGAVSVVITKGTMRHSAGRECSDHKWHSVPLPKAAAGLVRAADNRSDHKRHNAPLGDSGSGRN